MIKTVTESLAFMTLMSHIFILAFLLTFIAHKLKISNVYLKFKKLLFPYSYYFALLVSLAATFGSLFFSEIARINPCVLCWYQRIFMYPQFLLLYLAYLKDQKKVISFYVIALCIFGGLIALYQYTLQVFPQLQPVKCSTADPTSCFKHYTFYFGYVTIPLMALTGFILNIIFLSISKTAKK